MNIEVSLLNSFTVNEKGGNPAGVVLNADRLTDAQKLKIAQAVGYSETAFVSSDKRADYEVSFFTTTGEVDFCGHATLATFSALYNKGMVTAGTYVQRTKAGMLEVLVEADGKVIMEQQLPKKIAALSYQEISSVIGIESHLLESTKLPIEVISTGLADVIIPVPHGCLDAITPDDELIAAFCKQHRVIDLHVFELCDPQSGLSASCRNFAPLFGIPEESATGSANGALACYLSEHVNLTNDYVFEQGRAMNCTSLITASVETDNATVSSVRVGGYTSGIGSLTIQL